MTGRALVTDNPRRLRRGFVIAPILYMLGLIGIVSGVLYSGNMQIIRSNMALQNGLTAKNDLLAASNTLSAEAVFSADSQTLCPPRSVHQTSGNPCNAAPVALVQFGDLTATAQLPANYTFATSSGSPVEAGVFAAGAGLKLLDASGHYYIYCRWENLRSNPAAPAFAILSAGDNGKLETTCGDTATQGDDYFVVLSVGTAINRAALWQADTSNNVSYGATGSKLTVDSNGNLTAAGSISSLSAAITNGLTASSLTTTGDIAGKDFTASDNISGASGHFTDLTGTTLTIYGGASVSGTTTLSALSAQATTLSSLSISHDATIGGNLATSGTVTGGNANFGALTATSAAITNDITASNITASGTLTGTTGNLTDLNVTNATVTGTLTVANLSLSGNTTASIGTFTSLNVTDLTAANNITAGNTIAGVNLTASSNVTAIGTVTGTSGNFTSLSASGMAITNNASVGGSLTVTGLATVGSLSTTSATLSGTLSASGSSITGSESIGCGLADCIQIIGGASGNGANIVATSTVDSAVGINFRALGTGHATEFSYMNGAGGIEFAIGEQNTASNNYVYVKSGSSGIAPVLGTFGTDTTVNLLVSTKGSGKIGINISNPAAPLDVSGYLHITKYSAAPVTCSSSVDGDIALNHLYTLCICNGGASAWVKASDGATSCAW